MSLVDTIPDRLDWGKKEQVDPPENLSGKDQYHNWPALRVQGKACPFKGSAKGSKNQRKTNVVAIQAWKYDKKEPFLECKGKSWVLRGFGAAWRAEEQ